MLLHKLMCLSDYAWGRERDRERQRGSEFILRAKHKYVTDYANLYGLDKWFLYIAKNLSSRRREATVLMLPTESTTT